MSRRGFALRLIAAIALLVATLGVGDRAGVEIDEILLGSAAVALAVSALIAGIRAYRINLVPPVTPKIPASDLPMESSRSFSPLARLAARERELADHLCRLPGGVAGDSWSRASAAARTLRAHAARIAALEGSNGSSPAADADLDLRASRLREGVSAYERLTHTAGELAAGAGEGEKTGDAATRLADATDALVGLIRGLNS